MDMREQEAFLKFVRFGIGRLTSGLPHDLDWTALQSLAEKQGLLGVVLDGLVKMPQDQRPAKKDFLKLAGSVLQAEERHSAQWKSACEMAHYFSERGIRTYVLKGYVISECYPNPVHRNSADFDCFLRTEDTLLDAWEYGNQLMEQAGFVVIRDYYKNSAFYLPGLKVENHKFMVPFRGNDKLKKLEIVLESYLQADKGDDMIEGSFLFRPPVMLTALFMIEHSYSHFLHEGLTWRHVLDWMMFSAKHKNEIDWAIFDSQIEEFGFREFYSAYYHLGQFLLGDFEESALTKSEKRMLADIWAPLDLPETFYGLKGKLALVGNTMRARWKYHYFTDISIPHALWIQVKGYLFEKQPDLD